MTQLTEEQLFKIKLDEKKADDAKRNWKKQQKKLMLKK
jgi:hypothetical protein